MTSAAPDRSGHLLLRRVRKNPVLAGAIIAASILLFVTVLLVRVLREEKGQGLLSRHQVNLVNVANQVRAEMGSPWGPAPMLQSLIGGEPVTVVAAIDGMVAMLARLAAEVPDDIIPQRMLAGYQSDPLPAASELLARGQGLEALALYDAAIGSEVSMRTFADLSVDLRLYSLYLGRACAFLTASVMRPVDARRDLDLASFIRPSSVFPRALAVVLRIASRLPVVQLAVAVQADGERVRERVGAAMGRLLQMVHLKKRATVVTDERGLAPAALALAPHLLHDESQLLELDRILPTWRLPLRCRRPVAAAPPAASSGRRDQGHAR